MLKGGSKKVLSIATSVTYEEQKITMLEFDRKGGAMQVLTYNSRMHENILSLAIYKDLINERSVAISSVFAF